MALCGAGVGLPLPARAGGPTEVDGPRAADEASGVVGQVAKLEPRYRAEGEPSPPSTADAWAVALAEAEAGQPLAGYDEGFFIRTEDERFRLTINARFEARFTYWSPHAAHEEYNFSISRARLALGGHAFTKALRFQLQAAFDRGQVSLKDVYADYAFVPHWLQVRVGQYKRPLARDQISSSIDFQFNERAITNLGMAAARDIGVMVHNGYRSSPPFEYAVGVFNDTGEAPWLSGTVQVDPATGQGEIVGGQFSNVPERFRPGLVARLGYNHGGIKGYREVDFEGGPLRFAVGGSAHLSLCTADCNPAAGGMGSSVVGRLDHMVKAYGFTLTAGGVLGFDQQGASFADQGYALAGFHGQAGYLILDLLHPAVRYARLHLAEQGVVHEVGGAVTVFFLDEHLAWRTDALSFLSSEPPDTPRDYMVRTQLQAML